MRECMSVESAVPTDNAEQFGTADEFAFQIVVLDGFCEVVHHVTRILRLLALGLG